MVRLLILSLYGVDLVSSLVWRTELIVDQVLRGFLQLFLNKL